MTQSRGRRVKIIGVFPNSKSLVTGDMDCGAQLLSLEQLGAAASISAVLLALQFDNIRAFLGVFERGLQRVGRLGVDDK